MTKTAKKARFLNVVLAAAMAAAVVTSLDAGAQSGAQVQQAPALKAQTLKKPSVPRPAGKNIKSRPVVVKGHKWVQFFDIKTGEHTGCHDSDNQMSCEGSCPCK